MPTYQKLSQKNPQWDGPYWRRCRALYAGGKKLLGDKQIMADVFPPHLAEKPGVYAERCKRAYVIPYAGEIIDMITSALFSSDLNMTFDGEPDPWYEDWAKDVSPPGGQKQTLQRFLKEQITTALICKRAWTLVDLPEFDDAINDAVAQNKVVNAPAGSLKEQEQLGLLDAYACPLDPDCVWDWEEDRDGRLLWVLVHYRYSRRDGIDGDRDTITEQWMYYTISTWERYEISYNHKNPPQPPTDVPRVANGTHTFNRVPIIPLELTDGLWAMGKIESIAVAHLNKRNALSWAEYKSLFPVLTHFAGPPDPNNPASEDPDRVLNQPIGQGHVMQLADKDRLEFVGSDTGAFTMAAQDLNTLRDEMHRVVHQMALSVDNSAAALQRSAESKQVDQSASFVILREFGKIVREHAIELHEVLQVGRNDPKPVVWGADGMDNYADASVDSFVTQAQALEVITIPSPTFQRAFKYQVARRVLGDTVEEGTLEEIKDELEENITMEQFQAGALMAQAVVDQSNGIENPLTPQPTPPAGGPGKPAAEEDEKKPVNGTSAKDKPAAEKPATKSTKTGKPKSSKSA